MRAFFAVDLPADVVDGVVDAIASLRNDLPSGATFTPRAHIHVTLQFLGEISEERAAAAVEVARTVRAAPFEFVVGGTGAFPSLEAPRVLWIGAREESPLVDLANTLGAALAAQGFEIEKRAYHPHVTLARIKERRAGKRASEALKKIRFTPARVAVDRFVLYESRGGAYHPQAEIVLTPALTRDLTRD